MAMLNIWIARFWTNVELCFIRLQSQIVFGLRQFPWHHSWPTGHLIRCFPKKRQLKSGQVLHQISRTYRYLDAKLWLMYPLFFAKSLTRSQTSASCWIIVATKYYTACGTRPVIMIISCRDAIFFKSEFPLKVSAIASLFSITLQKDPDRNQTAEQFQNLLDIDKSDNQVDNQLNLGDDLMDLDDSY